MGQVIIGDNGKKYVPGEFFDAGGNRVAGLREATSEEAGALGFTDDELKSTARDDTHTPTDPLSGGPDLG